MCAGFAALAAFAALVGTPAAAAPSADWLAAVVVAPIFEEILYRDQLLRALRTGLGTTGAVISASALFAASHLAPAMVAIAFVAGSALCIVRLRTGSLGLCVGAHAGFNAAALAFGSRVAGAFAAFAALLGFSLPSAAGELAWSGTLSLELLAPGLSPIAFRGGGVATVNGGGGDFPLRSLRLDGGISGVVSVPVTDPDLAGSVQAVRVTASLGTGTLGPFWPTAPPGQAQLTRNTLPVHGAARLCAIASLCDVGLPLPFSTPGGEVGVGVGGAWTAGGFGPTRVSVEAAPWTLRTATVTATTVSGGSVGVPTAGWLHGPFSFASSAALTDGTLALVTPVRFAVSSGQTLPGFGRLSLRFVPEPRGLPLLAAGIAGLLGLAMRRLRNSQRPAGR
jgi:hypothetical protein